VPDISFLTPLILLLCAGTITLVPVFYSVVFSSPLSKGIHRNALSISAILGALLLIGLYAIDVPGSLVMSVAVWRLVNISLLLYSWNSDKIHPALFFTEFILGLAVLWKILAFFVPVMFPLTAYLSVITGTAIITSSLFAILFIAKISEALQEKKFQHLIWAIIGILIFKLLWVIVSLSTIQAEDLTENIILAQYLWLYAPVPIISGIVFGCLLPLIMYMVILSGRGSLLLKRIILINFFSIILGEFFFKYLLIQYGFSF